MPSTHNLRLFTDDHQIYIEDAGNKSFDYERLVTESAINDRVSVGPGIILIFTERNDDVPLTIRVTHYQEQLQLRDWDHVVRFSASFPSRTIIATGLMEPSSTAKPITLQAIENIVTVQFRGLSTLSEDGLEGEDEYVVTIYPGSGQKFEVLKRWRSTDAEKLAQEYTYDSLETRLYNLIPFSPAVAVDQATETLEQSAMKLLARSGVNAAGYSGDVLVGCLRNYSSLDDDAIIKFQAVVEKGRKYLKRQNKITKDVAAEYINECLKTMADMPDISDG